MTRPCYSQKENFLVDFAVPAEYRMKVKESGIRDKYFNRELKAPYNGKGTIISIIFGPLVRIPKSQEKRLGKLETVQARALL